MRALRPDALLAIEPGNLLIEAGRHHQFNGDRVEHPQGREWFAASPALMDHIAVMAQIYTTPDLATLVPPRRPQRSIRADVDSSEFEGLSDMELIALMKEAHALAVKAQAEADARFRKVVAEMRYEHGWTVTRIAEQIELSVSQTSRLIKAGKDL